MLYPESERSTASTDGLPAQAYAEAKYLASRAYSAEEAGVIRLRKKKALVYVPNAVASDEGTANLKPLGVAAQALHLELTPPPGTTSAAHASVSISSLGPIDNLQIAAIGLEPGKKYRLMLVGGGEPQELVTFSAGMGGTAIAQTFGPLKRAVAPSHSEQAMKLEVRAEERDGGLVLQQPTATPLKRSLFSETS